MDSDYRTFKTVPNCPICNHSMVMLYGIPQRDPKTLNKLFDEPAAAFKYGCAKCRTYTFMTTIAR